MRPVAPLFASALSALALLLRPSLAAADPVEPESPPPVLWSWQPTEPVPPGYTLAKRSRHGVVNAGIAMFAISYAVGFIGASINAATSGPTHDDWLFAPGFGPLGLMVSTPNPAANIVLAVDGIAQLGGIAMIAYGVASPTDVPVRSDQGLSLQVVPMMGGGRSGLGIVGRF